MSNFFNPNKQNVKFNILTFLSKNYPLSAKKIHKALSEKEVQVSYQYIHKVLSELNEEEVLTCENKNYSINVDWLKKIKSFVNTVDENYKLDYKLFSRRINSEVIHLLNKTENDQLIDDINNLISERTTQKLSEWYSQFYDPEDKEFKYLKTIADFKKKKILEIGCGTGRMTKRLLEYTNNITSIDNNEECIKYCKDNFKKGTFVHLDAREVGKVMQPKYDLIISGWVGLHYLPEKELLNTLNTFKNLLGKDGKLILLEAYYNTDYVHVLDLLAGNKNQIKEKVNQLKENLIEIFGDVTEKVIKTEYAFTSIEDIENSFKFELQYEHRVKWTENHMKILQDFLKSKQNKLALSEAPVCLLCIKSTN